MLVIMVLGSAAFLVNSLKPSTLRLAQEKKNSEVLAQARDALIGYAATVSLNTFTTRRPGDLPCPDTLGNGSSVSPCSGNAIGRLPWKTLGLPDLRDSSGEQLWYAVSSNFKNSPRASCGSPGQAGCLNSDSDGTVTLRASDGSVVNDGGSSSGVVAVVIAPGPVLTRQGSGSAQDRSSSGLNTAANYLDVATVGGVTEDNADFTDASSSNGFINGPIYDANGFATVNDQILAVTQDSIMQAIEKRVAAEVRMCLTEYASRAQNNGRYPWASRVRPTSAPEYSDRTGYLFGRLPDATFSNTSTWDSWWAMYGSWTANCNINSTSGWWLNWKELVFFGLADAYKPVWFAPAPAANSCATAGACLTVNPPSATGDKQFVVIVAGRTLSGQSRSNDSEKGTLSNYLEAPNPTPAYPYASYPTVFARGARTATFNDTVVFWP